MSNEPRMENLSEDEQKEATEGVERIDTPEMEAQKALMLEASKLVLHKPSWVHPQHDIFYRLAYLQVRKDEKAKNQPARVRTMIIRKLMNSMVTKMGKFFEEEQAKKAKENEDVSRRF